MKTLGGNRGGFLDLQTLIFLLFVICAAAGCTYVFFIRDKPIEDTFPKKVSIIQSTEVDQQFPEKYHDSDGHFTISYPAGWQISPSLNHTAAAVLNNIYLASPSGGITLTIKFQQVFVPSDCIPDYYDKPFQTTNRCFSSEYLTADPLPITAYSQTNNSVQQSQWYLTHYHYKTITINATELYASCLVIGKPSINKPEMGFELDHPVSHVLGSEGSDRGYLAACVDAGSLATDFSKPEVRTGETILRSLRFDNT